MNLKRLENTLKEINKFGYFDKGITRLAYTKTEKQAIDYFISLCKKEGMTVRNDACGNVIARREGVNPNLSVVACGSHLDTVIQGGRYDGTLGVVAGLEVIRSLNDKKIKTQHPIEIICFACEESTRFGVSTIGSKAMSGLLNKKSIEKLRDKDGISIKEAFSNYSLDFENIEKSVRHKEEFKVFLELHIEQGPILEREGKSIGIATGIASPTRFDVQIKGKADHSGTTPMNFRKDAFLGAAEIALNLEQAAKKEAFYGTVATVGVCEVKPGVMNVIPELVEMKIDIRGTSIESKNNVIKSFFENVKQLKRTKGYDISVSQISNEEPVNLDPLVIQSLKENCRDQGFSHTYMPSGAGHDAMNMAKLCPTGLIFVPSKGGISHHYDEYTPIEQIGIGASLLEVEIIKWANEKKESISKCDELERTS